MTYLIEAGTDPSKIVLVGGGERLPITSNEAEDGRAENRRGDVLERGPKTTNRDWAMIE